MVEEAKWVLILYIQANAGGAIRNLGSRGLLLDDQMAILAEELKIGWYRDQNGVWSFDAAIRQSPDPKGGVWRQV